MSDGEPGLRMSRIRTLDESMANVAMTLGSNGEGSSLSRAGGTVGEGRSGAPSGIVGS